jgi:hypothetical protein
MDRRFERRQSTRGRVTLTALVRRGRRRNPSVLRVVNVGGGGARCRTRTPLRLGATFHADFFLEGKCVVGHPRVLRLYCRVVWTAARVGPSCPIQEVGLAFPELLPAERQILVSLQRAAEAA